ncbi:uncharacterized protein LACBIDRAFT_307462 [Laccaria bicolor S238N-H82]|uniref:Predicted protein n=1 Tax=Laccaria bicolor (strain S238N-H82 / ATCC MYA-4686) TaxID=486041 RepID=B0DQ75_LACBS|nr:uncharacterized protein LACBIDRAFT_307462 [Laccaria bicolor S238N-H82]EDR03336.1 predicted protein [Laccaria bicolor S238N-H82]|eukprot:XP_001886132.1 predicted protein [Laccaria bicolor S238N-H82]
MTNFLDTSCNIFARWPLEELSSGPIIFKPVFRWLLTRTRSIKQVTGTQFPRVLPIYDLLFTPVIGEYDVNLEMQFGYTSGISFLSPLHPAPHHATLITSSMSLLRPFKATELFKPSNRTFNLNYEVTLDSFLKQPRYPVRNSLS